MSTIAVGITSVALLAVGPPATRPAESRTDDAQAHFILSLPRGFTVRQRPNTVEFDPFDVYDGTTPVLGIFVGNVPEYLPKSRGDADVTTFHAAGVDGVWAWDGTRLLRRDVRLRTGTKAGWPKYVDAWTDPGPPEQVAKADKVLSSLRTRTPDGAAAALSTRQ